MGPLDKTYFAATGFPETMPRIVLVAAMMVATILAGCLTGPGRAGDGDNGDTSASGRTLPPDLVMDGAEVVQRNESSVTWQWNGIASIGYHFVVGTVVSTAFDVPRDVPVRAEAHLQFDATFADLALAIMGPEGGDTEADRWCLDVESGRTDTTDPPGGAVEAHRHCTATFGLPGMPEGRPEIRVYGELAIAQVPFTVKLTLTLADDPQAALLLSSFVAPESEGGPEPSIGVTREGNLFTNIVSDVYRSDDGGLTWTNLGDPNPGIPNSDPDLAVDRDGTVWESRLVSAACNAVSVSRDSGQSWNNHQAVCVGPVHDRQYVVPTHNGHAILFSQQFPSNQHFALRTEDFGDTWTPMGPMEFPSRDLINNGAGWSGGGFWNEARDSVWTTYTWRQGPHPAATDAWYPAALISRDDLTWEVSLGPQFVGTAVGLGLVVGAADEEGNVYLAWVEKRGTGASADLPVMMAVSRDDGMTWSEPIRVDDGTGSHIFPAIVAGSKGQVAIAYYEANEDGDPDLLEWSAHWTVTLASTSDALAEDVQWERMPASHGPVKRGAICPSGALCDGEREFADYFRITAMPDGRIGIIHNSMYAPEGAYRRVNVFSVTDQIIFRSEDD